jgi:hypothetical protein
MKRLLFTFLTLFFLEAQPLNTYKQTFNYINWQLDILHYNYGYSKKEIWVLSKKIRYKVFFRPEMRHKVNGSYYFDLDIVDQIIDDEVEKFIHPIDEELRNLKWLW